MKETKIQWHSAFVSAMGLDFEKNRADSVLEVSISAKRKSFWRK